MGGELGSVDRDRGLLLRFGSCLVLGGGELLLPRLDAGRSPGYFLPDVGIGVGVAFRFDEGLVVLIREGFISPECTRKSPSHHMMGYLKVTLETRVDEPE